MGETETPHLYDFGISGGVPEPHNQYFYLWRPQDTFKNQRKLKTLLNIIILISFKKIGTEEPRRLV